MVVPLEVDRLAAYRRPRSECCMFEVFVAGNSFRYFGVEGKGGKGVGGRVRCSLVSKAHAKGKAHTFPSS